MKAPLISVCMICYNVEPFIGDAIEGVLNQKTDYPVELVIGDDCSTDQTLRIANEYAAKYPGRVKVLAFKDNLGIAGNTARTLEECNGKYVAICDSDDVWTDPLKLQKQVDFLEHNPDFGIVYSDVKTISEKNIPIPDPDIEGLRPFYSEGEVFFRLLECNFICNSTTVYRRELLEGHRIDPSRNYFVQDYIMWLMISSRSKVHFLPEQTTLYRKHSRSVTNSGSDIKRRGNKNMFQYYLYHAVANFDRFNTRALTEPERTILFRKMISLIYRRPGTLKMKLDILGRMPRYFPGVGALLRIGFSKVLHRLHWKESVV